MSRDRSLAWSVLMGTLPVAVVNVTGTVGPGAVGAAFAVAAAVYLLLTRRAR